ncbi:MAG: hypothetical protein OZX49_02378 [Immundisolibacter sp.]|nr:hypothetical protein [Immundisolibacter sp.]
MLKPRWQDNRAAALRALDAASAKSSPGISATTKRRPRAGAALTLRHLASQPLEEKLQTTLSLKCRPRWR